MSEVMGQATAESLTPLTAAAAKLAEMPWVDGLLATYKEQVETANAARITLSGIRATKYKQFADYLSNSDSELVEKFRTFKAQLAALEELVKAEFSANQPAEIDRDALKTALLDAVKACVASETVIQSVLGEDLFPAILELRAIPERVTRSKEAGAETSRRHRLSQVVVDGNALKVRDGSHPTISQLSAFTGVSIAEIQAALYASNDGSADLTSGETFTFEISDSKRTFTVEVTAR